MGPPSLNLKPIEHITSAQMKSQRLTWEPGGACLGPGEGVLKVGLWGSLELGQPSGVSRAPSSESLVLWEALTGNLSHLVLASGPVLPTGPTLLFQGRGVCGSCLMLMGPPVSVSPLRGGEPERAFPRLNFTPRLSRVRFSWGGGVPVRCGAWPPQSCHRSPTSALTLGALGSLHLRLRNSVS